MTHSRQVRSRRRTAVGALVVAAGVMLTALTPGATAAPGDVHAEIARDINPGDDGSFPYYIAAAGPNIFYRASHPTYGIELWKTNAAGVTSLVRNLVSGNGSSYPEMITAVGGRVFFTAEDGASDKELYVSDGTAAGTRRIKEINPFGNVDVGNLTDVNGTLFFSAVDTANDVELWKSDGTAAGTRRVRDIFPAGDSYPADFAVAGGLLYFTAVAPGGRYLWKSDGTAAGTVRVRALNLQPIHVTAVGSKVYFSGAVNTDTNDRELWVSDGTAAGTKVVRNINATAGEGSFPEELAAVGDRVYFSAVDANHDRELYTSDGTAAGTRRVRNINTFVSDNPAQTSSDPAQLTDVNGTLYFTAIKNFEMELWKSDGTFAGTVKLPESLGFGTSSPDQLTAVGDLLFYRTKTSIGSDQLWKTDGTPGGTEPVGPSGPSNNAQPGDLTDFGGTLYYREGFDAPEAPAGGTELWRATIEP
ncbi:hypothetical protein [Nocardioides humilatus]|nr:hypothetical protein [Nocardioides humilatus]